MKSLSCAADEVYGLIICHAPKFWNHFDNHEPNMTEPVEGKETGTPVI
jgi:hypothetical protein